MFSTDQLHDKTVLVTGASSGIGAATAVLFAKAGANVVVAARRAEKLAEVCKACEEANRAGQTGKGGRYAAISLDMRNLEQLERVVSLLPEWSKDVDVLGTSRAHTVNNAGLAIGTDKVSELDNDEIDRVLETNVLGLIHITQQFVREFKRRQAGHIINLGSIAGVYPYPGGSVYCASKAAVHAFTTSLTMELVDTPIRVSNIKPGLVETEFSVVRFRGDQSAADKVYQGIEPLTPEDIAEEIVWTASRKPHVNVAEVLIVPTNQASSYHIARK